ncbi:DUF1330 domain-containing protein [Vibrio sp. VB16]|uniref:DUF1330 domain-containing protein n=1 Tax=Vibrio sp. VB16 TaxID=2785746 RepID=UPI00189D8273|nr:DUF1330 domain-containing protein [Vibrio sp. VB16]UGA53574.1 DUF1330 domain-containing protein [Vibrio sp. VB16]
MKSMILSAIIAIAFPIMAMAEPAYYIFQLQIDDRDAYMKDYVSRVMPTIMEHKGKLLVASPDPQVVEGKWTGNQAVIIEFESRKAAEAWYSSSEYKAIRPYRLKAASTNNSILVDKFVFPK